MQLNLTKAKALDQALNLTQLQVQNLALTHALVQAQVALAEAQAALVLVRAQILIRTRAELQDRGVDTNEAI